MRLPGGRIRCETCGAVEPHDKMYGHWINHHAPKEGKTVREVREEGEKHAKS